MNTTSTDEFRLRAAVASKIPNWMLRALDKYRVYREYLIDAWHYSGSSCRDGQVTRTGARANQSRQLEGQVVRAYHQIEKGFTLPSIRRPFGARAVARIRDCDAIAGDTVPLPLSAALDHARGASAALRVFNETGEIADSIAHHATRSDDPRTAALVWDFFTRRHSVRNFDATREVAATSLQNAAKVAGESPSVCNRRPWRVRFLLHDGARQSALELQRGATGFGQTVPVVAVVTVERSFFTGAGERSQGLVDGGIFAMNLVWALELEGLSTCFLNWSKTNGETSALRLICGIPQSEDVVVLVAVGYAAEGHRVTRSPRRALDDLCMIIS